MDVRWVIWGLMTCRSVSMLWPCQHTYLDCFRCFCHFIVAPPTVLHCRSLHCHSLALSLLLYVAQLLRPTLSVTPNSLTVTLNCCHSLDIPGFVTPKRCHFLPCSIMASQSVVAFVLVVHGFPLTWWNYDTQPFRLYGSVRMLCQQADKSIRKAFVVLYGFGCFLVANAGNMQQKKPLAS